MKYTIAEAEKYFEILIDFAIAGEQVIICVDDYTAIQLVRIDNQESVRPSDGGSND